MSELINNFPDLLPIEIIERVKRLNSALLCDGMKDLGISMEGCLEASIMPVDINMKVIGTAITIDTDNGDNLPIHVATYAAKPGYVMVIDGKGYDERAYLGDLIIAAAKAIGIKAIVIDGYVRDREGCVKLGLPVYAKGFMQRGPIKKEPGKINYPIMCGGVRVNPGDLIVGDADGVTVVPRKHIEIVLEKSEQKLEYEIKREETIKAYEEAIINNTQVPQLAPQWVLNMLNK